nr:universal stress protein [Novosphingobium sp.]
MPFQFSPSASSPSPSEVVACIDLTAHSVNIAAAAGRLAETLGLPLTLLHVVEPHRDAGLRPDPLEWDLRCHQARRRLAQLSESLFLSGSCAKLEIEMGDCVRALLDRAAVTGSLLVLGARGNDNPARTCGLTAQRLLESGAASVLLVPTIPAGEGLSFERVLVPLDGSAFCEAAMAEAARISHRTRAEMVLIHVVPEPGLTLIGPPDADDLELRLRLDLRNEKAACNFLERTQRRYADQGLAVRNRCLKGDTRSTLLRAIAEEQPGLVVIAARGQGGRRCRDLSVGGTAAYLLAHLRSPLLLVSPANTIAERPVQKAPEIRNSASAFAA